MKRTAAIILNRNLPAATDALYEHLMEYDGQFTDVYVVEAGSDADKLSKYCTWYADSNEIKKNGLRYGRGMNYGLSKLLTEDKFYRYDAFFLLTNDTELRKTASIEELLKIIDENPRIGILSPCSERWGEKYLLTEEGVSFFWFIHNNAFFLRREFIECIGNFDKPDYMNFLFDGTNFRGYMMEEELIAKAYANDWAAAITNRVWVEENESHLLEHAQIIKTESFEENMKLYLQEGLAWIKKKYGFNSHWTMQQYVRQFYQSFFEFYPELKKYSIPQEDRGFGNN